MQYLKNQSGKINVYVILIIAVLFFGIGWVSNYWILPRDQQSNPVNTPTPLEPSPLQNESLTMKETAIKTHELPFYNSSEAGKRLYDHIKEQGWTDLDGNWFKLGMSLYEGKHYDEALEAFEIALSRNPSPKFKFAFTVWKGILLDLLGRREEAIAAYQKALENPAANDPWRFSQFSELVMSKETVKQWLKRPFRREEGAPPTQKTLEVMGEIHALGNISDPQKAESVYEKAQTIEGPQKNMIWWNNIAFSFFVGKKYPKALQAFKYQNSYHPNLWLVSPILAWQGHVLDLMNRREEAVVCYQKALDQFTGRVMRNGQFSIVINRPWIEQRIKSPFTLDIIHFSRKIENLVDPPNETELNHFIQKANELHLTNDLIWQKLGVYLLQAGREKEALELFKKSESFAENDFFWSYHPIVWQGHALDCLDRREEAISCYRRALDNISERNARPDYYPFELNRAWIEERLEHPFDPDGFDEFEKENNYFTSGNLVLSDCQNDRLVEVSLAKGTAKVVHTITWPTEDYSRRRPLGLSFDQNGYLYVGITAVPHSQETENQFPRGVAEILCISPSGKQRSVTIPQKYLKKPAWISCFQPREVFVMSNNLEQTLPISAYRLRLSRYKKLGETASCEIIGFTVSRKELSNGCPLASEDGMVYIPSNNEQCIQVFDENGGEPIRTINTKANYHFLSHIEKSNQLLAITKSEPSMPPNEIHRIDLEGNIVGRYEVETHGLQSIWNAAFLPDSTRFVVVDYSPTQQSHNKLFIWDADKLSQPPEILNMDWGEHTKLTDEAYFDYQMVP